jgi:hypothetical protein
MEPARGPDSGGPIGKDLTPRRVSRASVDHVRLTRYLVAHASAAITRGSLHRAFRVVRNMTASRNPASRNSSRKAPPSFAPATQANHSASVK